MSGTVNLSPGSTVPKTGKCKCEFCCEGRVADFFGQPLKEMGQHDAQLQEVGNQSNTQFFEAGQKFTECPICGPATGWTLVGEASEAGTPTIQRYEEGLTADLKKTETNAEKSPDSGRQFEPSRTDSAPFSAANTGDEKTIPSASSSLRSSKGSERQHTVAPQVLCHKCGSGIFEYDRAWKEYSCEQCGWIVEDPERLSALKRNMGERTSLNTAKQEIPHSRLDQDSVETEEQKKEVYASLEKIWEEERNRNARRTLDGVRVRPGQNPYTVGAMAMLQGMDNNVEQGRQEALRRFAAKYHFTQDQLLSILKEGNESN